MGHQYDNFDDAFADLSGSYAAAKLARERALYNAQAAYAGASDPVDKLHFGYATYAIEQLCLCLSMVADITASDYLHSHLYESIYWGNKDVAAPPEYELTWQKICEAWVANDFEGMEWTIACIDRMRQLMWDKPFSIKWASKPDSQRQ